MPRTAMRRHSRTSCAMLAPSLTRFPCQSSMPLHLSGDGTEAQRMALSLPPRLIYAERRRSKGHEPVPSSWRFMSMDVLPAVGRVALVLGILVAPLFTQAQQPGRVYRIGVLDDSSAAAAAGRVEALRKGLRDLGHVESQAVKIEWRFADGKETALLPLATELAGLKPDVLVSATGAGLAALRRVTTAIPIVAAGADADTETVTPQNLARPGRNITGVISIDRETDAQRMELLREVVPAKGSVATFWDCNTRNIAGCAARLVPETSRPERWGFTFIPTRVWTPDDFEGAFTTSIKEGARALYLANTALFYTHRRRL